MFRKILYGVAKAENNFCGYAPDYPGCLATGATIAETRFRLARALKAHIQAMVDDGDTLPDDDIDGGFMDIEVQAAPGKAPDGETLREYRKRTGMTQAALAARLEVTKATVNEWERGKRPLPGTMKFALAAIG